ncbi:MAG: aminotransferase class IV [Vicinamibacteria bacterium]|jgi:branched-chain amino acid aminotransferase|nr:aminotransferase class IV [Vicinamibacteria bacterium]
MGFFASVDGLITPAHEARVSVLDNGFTFGDAVYETLRTYSGRPFALARHLRRLRASAGRLGIAIPLADAELATRLDALLARAENAESYIRFVVSRGVGDISYHFDKVQGPTVVMVVKPYVFPPAAWRTEGVRVSLVDVRRNHPDALDPAIKSCNLLNNILAMRAAQAAGAMEAILLNASGEIAEGAGSNVFVVRGGEVLTPPLAAGILAGITREVLLELAPGCGVAIRETPLREGDLLGADEAFLTSTLKELAPITRVDDRAIGSGRPGPLTLRLLDAFQRHAPSESI